MLIDLEGKNKEDILAHLIKVIGKSAEQLKSDHLTKGKQNNPANFGVGCEKSCMCTIPGQLPCPSVVPLPYFMRGKWQKEQAELMKESKKMYK